jgi:hypothetical protein
MSPQHRTFASSKLGVTLILRSCYLLQGIEVSHEGLQFQHKPSDEKMKMVYTYEMFILLRNKKFIRQAFFKVSGDK